MSRRQTATLIVMSALGLGLVTAFAPSQERGFIEKGRRLYVRHCAACHGIDGKGNGPAAASLKTPPPDLTRLQPEGEAFPIYRVMNVIEGEKVVPAHGSREMPIWGTIFRRAHGEALMRSDIYALARYLEAIQAKRSP
jgi:mono/diheme cytochrome c family protein